MNNILKEKNTWAGIATILTAGGTYAGGQIDLSTLLIAIATGLGLIFSRGIEHK